MDDPNRAPGGYSPGDALRQEFPVHWGFPQGRRVLFGNLALCILDTMISLKFGMIEFSFQLERTVYGIYGDKPHDD